jgi:serine/threonine protein kinase
MLQACQRLGDFEIVRLLGKGGMGEVYEARQLNPPRPVALKVLAPWLAQDDDALRRFWREAAIPAQLDHPGIVRIIATGKTEDGVAYYSMQMVRGLSLSQLIRQGTRPAAGAAEATVAEALAEHTPSGAGAAPGTPPFTPAEGEPPILERYRRDRYRVAAAVGIQAALALASAHRHGQGVLHRDVKPSNLMVDHHDHLYLVDFGLTRALTDGEGSCTRPGVVCGTPWYMSPEQARGEALDGRSDLYSLGVVLYELASGGVGPFTASRSNRDAVLTEVLAGKVLPLRALAPDVPPALERIIHKAMAFKRGRRYRSGEELAADLEAFAGGRAPHRSAPAHRPGRGRWFGLLLAGSAVAVLSVALGLLLWGSGKPDSTGPESAGLHTGGEQGAKGPLKKAAEQPTGGLPALPDGLRRREENLAIPLLRANAQPRWWHRIYGKGRPAWGHRLGGLVLNSFAPGQCTLMALDNDPQRRWFEFAVDVQPTRQKLRDRHAAVATAAGVAAVPGPGGWLATCVLYADRTRLPAGQEVGLFFGWRSDPRAPEQSCRFLVVQLSEPAHGMPIPGQVALGTAYVDEARGGKAAFAEWYRKPHGKKWQRLIPPPQRHGWRRLSVRAVDDRLSVTVDRAPRPAIEFDMRELRAAHRADGADLDPRGALGVWVDRGTATFREASVTVLAAGKGKQ